MSQSTDLFTPYRMGSLILQNHIVMSPMARNRAIGNTPNALMAQYYAQRASAGLIVTEGTTPSPNGLGYPRMPGIFSQQQVDAWTQVTHAVHERGGTIFMQLMHTGRVSHALNLPAGARVLAPSAVAAAEQMYTDAKGMQPLPVPEAMSQDDIDHALQEFVQAAKNAMLAGFDGVELHGANGYLLEQFIRPNSNRRTDRYGGDIKGRARFPLQVAAAVAETIGKDKVGIRLSPFGVFNDMPNYAEMDSDYIYLAQKLGELGLVYLHIADLSSMGMPPVGDAIKSAMRQVFKNTFILSGGYDRTRAEQDLHAGKGDLIAVGRPFLANPDLPKRWSLTAALNEPDYATFYTPGEKGYIDYASLEN